MYGGDFDQQQANTVASNFYSSSASAPTSAFGTFFGPVQAPVETIGESVTAPVPPVKSSPGPSMPGQAKKVSSHPYSVGAAIQDLEDNLASKGIVVHVPDVKREPNKTDKADGKLLRLPFIISLGIVHAIDTSDATEVNVAHISSDVSKVLVPGKVVALHYGSGNQPAFLRLMGDTADYGGGRRGIQQLALGCNSERFVIVRARDDRIAFYSPTQRRFLGCRNGNMTAGYPIVHLDEIPRANESFSVVSGEKINIRLFCPIENTHLPSSNG